MSADHPGTRSRQHLPWAIAAIAVVALVANLLWERPGDDGADAALAELTERLDALEAGPPRRSPQVSPGRIDAAAGVEGGDASILGATEQTPAEIAAARERQLKELEAGFARDVPDPMGGPATEDLLVETISGETMAGTGLRPRNVDIACKQSSCRIVGSFDSMGDAQDWGLFYITAAGGNVLSKTQMVFVPGADGRTEVRIYSERAKD